MPRDAVLSKCLGFLNTPPLWLNKQFGIRQFDFPDLDLKEFITQAIPKNIRLGHQMEHVFKQLITHAPNFEILVYNLPVKRGKRTLGEIDFILKEIVSRKMIHVELTYKFYIIDPGNTEPIYRLMGPNRRDMFFAKMEKIKKNQFKLIHIIEGSKALIKNNIDHKSITHETCYKAQLFTPYGDSSITIHPLNKKCVFGFWLGFSEFNSNEFQAYQFYIPIKSEWVITPHTRVHWTSHRETLIEIKLRMLSENAPMVWIKKAENEFEKCFVVWCS